jgi:hypothetical protein
VSRRSQAESVVYDLKKQLQGARAVGGWGGIGGGGMRLTSSGGMGGGGGVGGEGKSLAAEKTILELSLEVDRERGRRKEVELMLERLEEERRRGGAEREREKERERQERDWGIGVEVESPSAIMDRSSNDSLVPASGGSRRGSVTSQISVSGNESLRDGLRGGHWSAISVAESVKGGIGTPMNVRGGGRGDGQTVEGDWRSSTVSVLDHHQTSVTGVSPGAAAGLGGDQQGDGSGGVGIGGGGGGGAPRMSPQKRREMMKREQEQYFKNVGFGQLFPKKTAGNMREPPWNDWAGARGR